MTAPVAYRLEPFAGWGLHPLESAALARRTPGADGHGAPVQCLQYSYFVEKLEFERVTIFRQMRF
jgi:hypothetical protein